MEPGHGDCTGTPQLGQKILYSADVPPFVCYECACLLEKCVKFKEKCLLGQNILFDILQDKNEITKEDIISVDRIKSNLVSSLTISPIRKDHYFEFTYEEADSDDDRFNADYEPLQLLVKEEKVAQLHDDNFQSDPHDHSDEDEEMNIQCIICKKTLSKPNISVLNIQEFKKMRRISLQLKDGLFSLMNSVDEAKVHTKCKKKYCEITSTIVKGPKNDKENTVILSKAYMSVECRQDEYESKTQCSTETIENAARLEPMDCEYPKEENKEQHSEQECGNDTKCGNMEYCVICHEKLLDNCKIVAAQELETFKKLSLLRGDGLYNFFNFVNEVRVHDKCEGAYRTAGDNKYLKLIFCDGSCLSSLRKNNDIDLEDQKCVICRGTRSDEFKKFKIVSIERFKRFSLLRNDGLFHLFKSVNEITVHRFCRVYYNRVNPKGIYKPLKLKPMSCKKHLNTAPNKTKKEKRRKPNFRVVYGPIKEFIIGKVVDYERECFICTRILRPTTEMRKSLSARRVVNTVTHPACREEIVKHLQKIKSSPEFSEYKNVNETMERISKLDLVGIGAQYHTNCYNDILNPRSNIRVGRTYINKAINTILKYIEEVGEDSEFSLSELTSILTDDDYIPDHRTIKKHLIKRYNDRVTFVSSKHDTIVVFKN